MRQPADVIAHDLNNLLASILNYASFVQVELATAATNDGERWDQALRDVEQIREAAERATVVTRELSSGNG